MKALTRFSLPALTSVLILSGCSSSKPTDSQLAASVQSQIAADSALQGQPITATANNGVVTLTGNVPGEPARELAANDAAKVKGVGTVVNNLAVGGSAAAAAMNSAPPPPPSSQPANSAPYTPQAMVIPAGTRIRVRLGQTISTKTSQVGDQFSGVLISPVQVNGQTVIRPGARARGTVIDSKGQGRFKGAATLAIRLDALQIDGRSYPVRTSSVERVEKGKGKRSAIMTGGGAGLGAIIGGVAGGGKGALIGGLVGGGGGAAGSAFTGNHDLVLPAESILTFRLQSDVRLRG